MVIEEILDYLRKQKLYLATVHVGKIVDKYKKIEARNAARDDQSGESAISTCQPS